MKGNICKYTVYILLLVVQILLFWNIKLDLVKTDNLLTLLTSATSITVAILVTYFFSKLFAEKQERIQRKTIIDDFSQMVTAQRRIIYNIRTDHGFWKQYGVIKSLLDSQKYEKFTVEEFWSADHEKRNQLIAEFGGEVVPQAYLSMRALENNETSFEFFRRFKLQNYSSDEIVRFKEYCLHIWSFFNEKRPTFTLYENIDQLKLDYNFITKKQLSVTSPTNDITFLLNEFNEKIFKECQYHTMLNERKMPIQFYWISINLVTYLLLTIATLMTYILPIDIENKSFMTLIFLSLFSTNTIDLIVGLFSSVKKELTITDFYKI